MTTPLATLRPVSAGASLWFDVAEAASVLGMDPDHMLSHLRAECVSSDPNRADASLVSEAGIYMLAALQDSDLRTSLDHWVFSSMLPYIRVSVEAIMSGQAPPALTAEPPPAIALLIAALAAPKEAQPMH